MMDTQLLISGVIFGLSIGSIFFLMAIGLSLCFGLMRIISLDQLLYYSIGAYITYSISLVTGSLWLGALAGMVVAGVISFGVERFIFLRIYERDIAFTMIASFGVLIGGVGVIKSIWGVIPVRFPFRWSLRSAFWAQKFLSTDCLSSSSPFSFMSRSGSF